MKVTTVAIVLSCLAGSGLAAPATEATQKQAAGFGSGEGLIGGAACFASSIIGTGESCGKGHKSGDSDEKDHSHTKPSSSKAPPKDTDTSYDYTYKTSGDGKVTYVITPKGHKPCTYTVKAPSNLKDSDTLDRLAAKCTA